MYMFFLIILLVVVIIAVIYYGGPIKLLHAVMDLFRKPEGTTGRGEYFGNGKNAPIDGYFENVTMSDQGGSVGSILNVDDEGPVFGSYEHMYGGAPRVKSGEAGDRGDGKRTEHVFDPTKKIVATMGLQDRWLESIKSGKKTVEGRLGLGRSAHLKSGDVIIFNHDAVCKVKSVEKYPTFKDLLEKEGIDKVLPGISSVDEGVKVYREFYDEPREKEHGAIAIRLSVLG